MYSITDLKVGVTFEMDGDIYKVLSSVHSKTGRAGAVLRTKIKNLVSGSIIEKTFKGSDKFEPAKLDRKKCQYLYREGNEFFFMNSVTYDQFSLEKSVVGDTKDFIKENEEVTLLYFKSKPLSIDLSPKVDLKVTKSENWVKGDTASGSTKPSVLETGYELQVPLFIKEGDTVRVNTQTGNYVERV